MNSGSVWAPVGRQPPLATELADVGFAYLRAPVVQVTALDTPTPYSKPMEDYVLPSEEKIAVAVREVLSIAPVA